MSADNQRPTRRQYIQSWLIVLACILAFVPIIYIQANLMHIPAVKAALFLFYVLGVPGFCMFIGIKESGGLQKVTQGQRFLYSSIWGALIVMLSIKFYGN